MIFRWLRKRRDYRELVTRDAMEMIEGYGPNEGYYLASHRSTAAFDTVLDSNRPDGHWDRVRREIKRLTRREDRLDTATRMSDRDV